MSTIPYGLLDSVPLKKIDNTEIIYDSGNITPSGITICESETPLILELPGSEIGTKKKIFSNIDTLIKTENSEFKLSELGNFIEFIFTNTGWVTLNNPEQTHQKKIYYESKENIENYKILKSESYLVIYNTEEILIFKNQNLLKTLKFLEIRNIQITGDWIFILSNKFQYYDITFDKINDLNIIPNNFWTQKSKYHLLLQINNVYKIYIYSDFQWRYIMDTDKKVNIFISDGITTAVSFENNKMIELRLDTQETKILELQKKGNLGIWKFDQDYLILNWVDNELSCILNFSKISILDNFSEITDIEIVKWNQRFLILKIDKKLRIYQFGESEVKCTLNSEIFGNWQFVEDGIYSILDNKIFFEKIYI